MEESEDKQSPRFRRSVDKASDKNADVEVVENPVQSLTSVQYQLNVVSPSSYENNTA